LKRFLLVLVLTVMVVCSLFTVSAATKDDLIAAMEKVPATSNEVFHDGAIYQIQLANLTSEQIDGLILLCKEAESIIPANKGARARDYKQEDWNKIIGLLDRACELTDYSYVVEYKGRASYRLIIYAPVKNNEGKVVSKKLAFYYDDGIIAPTGENEFNMSYIYLAAGVLLLAAAVVVVVRRKSANNV